MSVEWKPDPLMASLSKMAGREKPEEEYVMHAESNGAKLSVHSVDSEDDGLHVRWDVKRPRKVLRVHGNISCTKEELRSAFAKAKKLAEDFALCWPNDLN